MRRILIIILFGVIAFVVIKVSTSGWKFSKKSFSGHGKNPELVEILKSHVYKLAHVIGDRSVYKPDKLNEAANYITEQFSSYGYDVEFQTYTLMGQATRNIIACKRGKVPAVSLRNKDAGKTNPDEVVIVGAHYDTCFNPGANDNASAVAGLLELARLMFNKEIDCTIKFIAFVNEEPPFFKTENMGSCVYAKDAKERGEKIKAVIILEMIGYYSDEPKSQKYPPLFGLFYPSKANFIAVVGNFSSKWLVKKTVTAFEKGAEFPIESIVTFDFVPGVDFSDHWSFWREGYPAIMVTDTAFYRYSHYHTQLDTYEKLDYESMAEVVKGLESVLMEIGISF